MSDSSTGRGAIGMAVYRPDRELLRVQLESIAAQTFADWTCVIGIDGTDGATAEDIRLLVGEDPRFRIVQYEANVGFYRNFERVIAECASLQIAWVALADQDDEWYPEKLAYLSRKLAATGASAVSGQAQVVDGRGNLLRLTDRRSVSTLALLLDNQVTGSFSLFDAECVRSALPFPKPTTAAYHDHWLGMVAHSSRGVAFADRPLQNYVQHDANVLGETAGSLSKRFGRLGPAGRASWFQTLVIERWGWRSTMARTVLSRGAKTDVSTLALVARPEVRPRVAIGILKCVVTRQAAPLRGLALLVGYLLSAVTPGRSKSRGSKMLDRLMWRGQKS